MSFLCKLFSAENARNPGAKMSRVTGAFVYGAVVVLSALQPLRANKYPAAFSVSSGNVTVTVTVPSAPGTSYILQRNTDVLTRYWADRTEPVASGSDQTLQDTFSGDRTFWRVFEFNEEVFWYDWTYYPSATNLPAWGLGNSQSTYNHTDRTYEWYIDQGNTGAASNSNCGPSTVTMAIKWYDAAYTGTAEDARNWSYSWRSNGWWYTNDVVDYLNLKSVPNTTSTFLGASQLKGLLEQGKLIILCIDTTYLTRNHQSAQRVGRFYDYGGGHFLLLKGVRTVSGSLYFESYDPNNWNKNYADGTPMGRNRHFSDTDLVEAISRWWNYIIVVSAPGGGGEMGQPLETLLDPVDPDKIPHAGAYAPNAL